MATLDVGKIKFTWRGTYSAATAYEADDVVHYQGNAYVCTQNTTAGTDPSNASYWDVMAEGTNVLTTQGDILTHDGANTIRLPRGDGGQVVKMDGNDVTWANEEGWSGMRVLQPNYGEYPADPNAATTYGANGSRPWLADYANNWIPESGIPNRSCGPIADLNNGSNDGNYRWYACINENHEIVQWGYDYYYFKYHNNGNRHAKGVAMNVSQEFGGLREGDYFVRLWTGYGNIWALTKDGDLFCAGNNSVGQLGLGDTTDRYNLVKIPGLGPDATHNGQTCRIACFHYNTCTGTSMLNNQCYAIDEHGRLFVWGYNGNGALGIGNTTNQTYPQLVSVNNVVQVSAGYQNALLVDNTGEMYYTGANTNGVGAGSSPNSFTTTSQTNVYACHMSANYYYSGGWVFRATAYYLANNGDMYGIGRNNSGSIGNGTTTDLSGWTKTSGATKFAEFAPFGAGDYRGMGAIGGTPGNPNDTLYVWGYNGNGQLGIGTTTSQTSPTQPQTITNYTRNTPVSTDTTIAPSLTPTPFPRTSIKKIIGLSGMQGHSTGQLYVMDDKHRGWWCGYTNSKHYWQNNTGNANNTNYSMDHGPWCTTATITGTSHWSGKTATRLRTVQVFGNAYGSEGTMYGYTADGRLWGWGYNGQGQIVDDQNYIDNWVQLAP